MDDQVPAHWFFGIRTCWQRLTNLTRELAGFARGTFDPRMGYLSLDYSDLFERLSDKPFSGEGTDSVEPLFAEVGVYVRYSNTWKRKSFVFSSFCAGAIGRCA